MNVWQYAIARKHFQLSAASYDRELTPPEQSLIETLAPIVQLYEAVDMQPAPVKGGKSCPTATNGAGGARKI